MSGIKLLLENIQLGATGIVRRENRRPTVGEEKYPIYKEKRPLMGHNGKRI